MTFVQITFGSTINRQLRNIVSWMTSENMVLRYINTFRTAFWPNDETNEQDKTNHKVHDKNNVSNPLLDTDKEKYNRTDKDKLITRRAIEAALFPQSTSTSGCLPEVNSYL